MKYEDLKSKWWWRTLQVVFVISACILFIITIFGWYSDRPKTTIEQNESTIKCEDGRIVPKLLKPEIYSENSWMMSSDEKDIKIYCSASDLNSKYGFIPDERNFTIYPKFNKPGVVQWGKHIGLLVLAFSIELAVFLMLRTIALYIITGRFRK